MTETAKALQDMIFRVEGQITVYSKLISLLLVARLSEAELERSLQALEDQRGDNIQSLDPAGLDGIADALNAVRSHLAEFRQSKPS